MIVSAGAECFLEARSLTKALGLWCRYCYSFKLPMLVCISDCVRLCVCVGWLQSELVGELAEKEEAVLSLRRQMTEMQEHAEVRL